MRNKRSGATNSNPSTVESKTDALNRAAAEMIANYSSFGLGASPPAGNDATPPVAETAATPLSVEEINAGAIRFASQLDEFLSNKKTSNKAAEILKGDLSQLSESAVSDLQLATARKLRELLPTNRELLQKSQEQNWIQILLSWLNLHDRPAVQIEALLALTSFAELCAQQSYYQHAQAQTSSLASAAQAVAAAAQGSSSAANSIYNSLSGGKNAPGTFPYPSLVAPAPGSVPFPPLSFSQTLSEDAVAAFDASLATTIQNSNMLDRNGQDSASFSLPPAPLFPSSTPVPPMLQNSTSNSASGGINFTSLAPPPGGAHSTVPSNSFLPPPTPVRAAGSTLPSFPQHLSASSQHLLLRHADAIPTLISLLSNPNREVYEQAMWILGSIAVGDSPNSGSSGGSTGNSSLDRDKSVSARDVILAAGVMNQLLRCLEAHPQNVSLQRIGTWTLSNLLDGIHAGHGKTSKSSDYSSSDEIDMSTLLPVLRRLLNYPDPEVLSYTCWTLSHLCDGPSSHIAAIVTTTDPKHPPGGLVPKLVDLLSHLSWRVTKPALRTIGNIVCAECSDDTTSGTSTDYTEVILLCNAVPKLKELIGHSNREIQKEACWTLSNIAAGTVDQIQAVLDSGAIDPLVKLVKDKKTDQEVRSEACWVVLNATSCGSDSQIETLVDHGCVSVLGVLLTEASMVMMALEGLERVLQVEEAREVLRQHRIRLGEIPDDESTRTPTLVSSELIEKAKANHSGGSVTKRADKIWKQHFVSCALCKKSFSKHRSADATFCNECKCYVCSNCNCQVYHLSYQEELWAETEEKETQQKKSSKSKKNKKKKEKAKMKKAKSQQDEVESRSGKDSSSVPDTTPDDDKGSNAGDKPATDPEEKESEEHVEEELSNAKDEKSRTRPPAIDFVLYLQQTGSIIALAKLMDALDYGEDNDEPLDETLDDAELQFIRQQMRATEQAS